MDPLKPDEYGGDVAAEDRRDDIAAKREAMLDYRDDAVQALLVLAEHRDRLAEERDRQADERDQAADRRPFTSPVEYAAAALDRGLSAMDRYESGVDRDLSASDRAEIIALLPRGSRRRLLDDA